MDFWRKEMTTPGYGWVLVSTQSDENAQHFYRAPGYEDCGYLIAPAQPAEMFFGKRLGS